MDNYKEFKLQSIHGDEYYTQINDVLTIADYINIEPGSSIWLPFNDEGRAFDIVLKEKGYNTICTQGDFFNTPCPENCRYIISNPPFSKKRKYCRELTSSDLNIY